jgi:heptaprenyl diphosphate synthase
MLHRGAGWDRPRALPYGHGVAAGNPLLELPALRADLGRVEVALRESVRADDPFLTEMASHLIMAGGKRGRPAFALGAAATASLGPVPDAVVQGAVSVELVHLGSLYHDDVMDEARTRRSVDSVNARWGNLQAILAGDFLLARASEMAAALGTEVAALLAATISRLCEGQVRELQHTYDVDRSEEAYLASITGKTASLFSSSCRIGSIAAGLPRPQIDALTRFGLAYGMAFQIVDDILDVVADDDQLGKPAGHDLIEGVYTLPVIRTLAEDTADAKRLRDLLGSPLTEAEMHEARQIVRGTDAVPSSLATAQAFVADAAAGLAPVAEGDARRGLEGAAEHLLGSARDIVATLA